MAWSANAGFWRTKLPVERQLGVAVFDLRSLRRTRSSHVARATDPGNTPHFLGHKAWFSPQIRLESAVTWDGFSLGRVRPYATPKTRVEREPAMPSTARPEPRIGSAGHRPGRALALLAGRGALAALAESELLDTPAEEAFDRFTRLAAKWLGVPVALVSLVDDHRQFFKSAVGLREPWASLREVPLSHSFCQYGVTSGEPLIVTDAREHPWLRQNSAITELNAIAYAGIPLLTADGQVLGCFA